MVIVLHNTYNCLCACAFTSVYRNNIDKAYGGYFTYVTTKLSGYPSRSWPNAITLEASFFIRGIIKIICGKHAILTATGRWHNHLGAGLPKS